MYALVALALVMFGAACTDNVNTVRTLKAHGFTEIRTTGFEPFECSDSDTFATGFTARNVQGLIVRGAVCCGMMTKGCTVRF
jgi:hypothetical protein